MPFADGEFDYLLTMSGLQAFPDKERALREMHRVLKPGGRLCGCFYVRGEHRVGDWIINNFYLKKENDREHFMVINFNDNYYSCLLYTSRCV